MSILLMAGWLRFICCAARCMLRVRPNVSISSKWRNLSQPQKLEKDRSDMAIPQAGDNPTLSNTEYISLEFIERPP
ncbi:hypothetical protein D3C78_1880340 [compost metagenome]